MGTQIKGTSTRNLLPIAQPVAPLQLLPFPQLVHRLLDHARLGRLQHADDAGQVKAIPNRPLL